ncbi:hypothetical protein BC829DRAFT_147381 [Chytridium lagenaria]|nr:hypothetical protein BC829DRAFT_147381 [Chytridium lagenaria]
MAQTPKAIKDVHTYLAAHGPVPFIVRLPPSLRASPNIISASEEFVHGVKSFTASVTFKQPKTYGGVVFVFLPATLFPKDTAADVTVQGGKIDVGKVVDGIAESAGNGRVVRFLVDIKKVDDVDEMKITATFKPKSTASTSWSVTLNGSPVSEVDPTSTPAPVKPNKKTRTPPTSTTPPTTVTAKPPKPPAYIPHRHTESGVRALKLLKALYQDESMWTVETEDQRGVRISTIEVEGNQMPIVRGDAVFPSEWTPEDVVGVIRNVGARKIWDQRFDDGVIKEWLNPNEFVFQAWLKSNKPQGERDVCGLQVTIYDSSTQTHYIMITSITDPLSPLTPVVSAPTWQ